jgi:hypothetical protein
MKLHTLQSRMITSYLLNQLVLLCLINAPSTSSWISTYMLVGTAKECKSVGQAGSAHSQLVQDVIVELSSAVATKEGIIFPPGTIQRLAAYTDVVSDFPCGVKEFQWRNKYFYDLGDAACPIHNGLLRECAARGKLGFELP